MSMLMRKTISAIRDSHDSSPPCRPRLLLKKTSRVEQYFEELLCHADVRVNGDGPWDMRVHDRAMFDRVLANGHSPWGSRTSPGSGIASSSTV